MNLYVVSSNEGPNFFCKASSEEEALEKFSKGLKNPEKFKDAAACICSMELFLKLVPDEFLICEDTSF